MRISPQRHRVSIRARVRRATARGHRRDAGEVVSIRARVRRATARVQERRVADDVSIRARVRRATLRDRDIAELKEFLSAPACGGRRHPACDGRINRASFYPRPRAAGDKAPFSGTTISGGFYPRPRAAGDDRSVRIDGGHGVSIRARVRRATAHDNHTPLELWFLSAPACGGRRIYVSDNGGAFSVSIRARVRRATGLVR